MKNLLQFSVFLSFLIFIISGCDEAAYDDNLPQGYYAKEEAGPNRERYGEYEENPFVNTADEAISTFSIDADGGAYSNMRRFANLSQKPPKYSVRVEEFLNYFTFNYPEPASGETVALDGEIATCPWNEEHHILRIGIKGKSLPLESLPPSNYVFLIDVSGSMDSPDKIGILKSGFKEMVRHLEANDRVAIVTYAGQSAVALQSTPVSESNEIINVIEGLRAGGSTAGADGIRTAYAIASEYFVEGGNNRVILGTDGDFNVGTSSTDELVELIEEKREAGIYLTLLGVGEGNLNEHMMEQVANHGNGNYEYIDNARQVKKVFVWERSKFYTVAKDVKVQVRFNPERVQAYRLIGYENRVLDNNDFDNDSVDAGEIGSGQTITGLYEIILKHGNDQNEYARLDVRYKPDGEETSREITQKYLNAPSHISSASENTRFAAAVACYGLLLRESEYKGTVSKEMVLELSENTLKYDPNELRREFIDLVKYLDF